MQDRAEKANLSDIEKKDRPLLIDPDKFPERDSIKKALCSSFATYEQFLKELKAGFPYIEMEWKYYNDGKSWLCRAISKKKTVFWLSVWKGFLKVSCFFTEKTIVSLGQEVRANSDKVKNIGKLIPIVYSIKNSDQLALVFSLIDQKVKT